MSAAAAAAASPESTGLVLPDDVDPLRRVLALRRAEAWRLLKAHAASGDHAIARSLAALARAEPDVAVDVISDPAAAVLARAGRPAEAGDAWALELARRGRLAHAHQMRGRRVISTSLGLDLAWAEGVRVTVSDRAIAIAGAGPSRTMTIEDLRSVREPRLDVTEVLHELAPGIAFAIADANPLAMIEAHPDKQGNALSLGGRDASEWVGALRQGVEIVARHLPSVIEEMRALSFLVIPVGYEPEKHLSASYREYVGACYVTLHPDVRTLAEALVHEFQHNKVNLASYHDALLDNALDTMVRSPVRPDLRPIWGVLLAVHAFVSVAELYRRMLASGDARVAARLADVVARNDEGLRTLREHAEPTRIGAALLHDIETLHARHLELNLTRPEGVSWEG